MLTGFVEQFVGTDFEWSERREELLSSGEKYLINLPTPNGMLQTNDLLITGTKCNTISNMVTITLTALTEGIIKRSRSDCTPAILLLGGNLTRFFLPVAPWGRQVYKLHCVLVC